MTKPTRPTICRQCQDGYHGPRCGAAFFAGYCPCRCRTFLGLDGPFECGDPTAPTPEDLTGVIA